MLDDPFEPLTLPSDRPLLTAAQATRRALEQGGILHLVGAEGSAAALVARQIAQSRHVLYVAADPESATRALGDLGFLSQALPIDGWRSSKYPAPPHKISRAAAIGRAAAFTQDGRVEYCTKGL